MARLPFSTPRSKCIDKGERWYEPELLRLKAERLLAQTKPCEAEAEQCLESGDLFCAGARGEVLGTQSRNSTCRTLETARAPR